MLVAASLHVSPGGGLFSVLDRRLYANLPTAEFLCQFVEPLTKSRDRCSVVAYEQRDASISSSCRSSSHGNNRRMRRDGSHLLCPAPNRRGHKAMMLSDVCLSRTSGLSREQRGLGKLKWHRGSPRHTWLGHNFQGQKVKGQGHQAALLTTVLTRQAAAAVSVGTYWPWDTTTTLRSARRREAIRRPQREKRGGSISWRPPACYLGQ